MRPTYWILCLALLITWTFGLIRGFFKGGWQIYACCLGILFALCLAFWAIDPRTGPLHPLSGGYEAEMLEAIQDSKSPEIDPDDASQPLRARIMHEGAQLLTEHLPASFLGQQLPAIPNIVLSVLIIGSAILIARQQPLWAMFIVFTCCVTVMLSTAPRYYVMIMPFLLLGAFLLLRKFGEWFGGGWCDAVFGIGLLLLLILNIAKIVPLVYEQQRVPFYESGLRFYDHYRGGKFMPIMHLADLIREKVPPGANTITPSAQIVRYLSDRNVIMERELLPNRKGQRHYPERLSAARIAYAAFPAKIYQDKEPMLAQLVKHGVITEGARVETTTDGIRLSRAVIVIPAGDWTKASPPAPATAPTTRKARPTTHPTTAKAKPSTQKLKAAKVRRQKHAAATTQSTTKKRKKKHSATTSTTSAPTTQPAK